MEFPEALERVLQLAQLAAGKEFLTRAQLEADARAIDIVKTFALNYTTIRVKPSTTTGD